MRKIGNIEFDKILEILAQFWISLSWLNLVMVVWFWLKPILDTNLEVSFD